MKAQEDYKKNASQVENQLSSARASLDARLSDSFALSFKMQAPQLEEVRRLVDVYESVEIVDHVRKASEKDQKTASKLAFAYLSLSLGDENE